MKALNLILPFSVAIAVSGAFFAGRYIGEYDAEKLHAGSLQLQLATESADRLYIVGAVADLLKNSKSAEALRALEQYAKVQAPAVQECLKAADCSCWVAASEEHRAALKRYVSIYGDGVGQRLEMSIAFMRPNPSIERTATSGLRPPVSAAHVELQGLSQESSNSNR
jgi:hypothetical protein